MLTFKAFGDESTGRKIAEAKFYALGGFVGPIEVWPDFESAWKRQLDIEDIPAFESASCAHDPQIAARFADVILRFAIIGHVTAVALSPLRRFQTKIIELLGQKRRNEPHLIAFRSFVQFAAIRLADRPLDEQVAFVMHRHGYGFLCSAIYDDIIKNLDVPWIQRLGTITTNADERLVVPIQAADLLAYETWRWKEDGGTRNTRPAMQKLIASRRVSVLALSTGFFKKLIYNAKHAGTS